MTIVLPAIITERYREAVAEPTIPRWRSLAYLCGIMADNIQDQEPESVMADDIRTLSNVAWQHCMDMQPVRDEEDYNSLSGVIIGWFRKWRAA